MEFAIKTIEGQQDAAVTGPRKSRTLPYVPRNLSKQMVSISLIYRTFFSKPCRAPTWFLLKCLGTLSIIIGAFPAFQVLQTIENDCVSKNSMGVVYFGYNLNKDRAKEYVDRIIESSYGIRKYSPQLPIMLFTNSGYNGTHFEYIYDIPETLMLHGRQWWTRISLLSLTRFAYTLSIDSDRVICNDISSIFGLLDEFDMLGVSAGILPALDNGVIGYKAGRKFEILTGLWMEEQIRAGKDGNDQPSLARAIKRFKNYRVGVLDQSWQMKYIPAVGQPWGPECNMSRTLVIKQPIKIAAARTCPLETNSSKPRIYTSNRGRSPSVSIAYSQYDCDQLLNNDCLFREIDWMSDTQVLDKEEYLSLYLSD